MKAHQISTSSESRGLIKLLIKGLNFVIVPNILPVKQVMIEMEIACLVQYKDDNEKADQLRHEIVGVLQSVKPLQPNLTPEEWNSIKTLKENNDTCILVTFHYFNVKGYER